MHDLEKLTGVEFWVFVLGVLVWSVLLAVVLTWPVCALILTLYRRSVWAGMRVTAGGAVVVPEAPGTAVPAPRIAVAEVGDGTPAPLAVRARRRVRRAQVVYAGAGLVFGIGATTVYHLIPGTGFAPQPFLVQALLLSWLVVPTVVAIGFPGRRARVLAWAVYALLVVLLAMLGAPAETEVGGFLLGGVTLPGALVLATAAPALRGVAWLVAPALAALGLAAVATYPPLLYIKYGLAFDRLMWTLLAVAVACLLLVGLYGAAVAVLYARKWAGDETLLILQWWFVLALTLAAFLGTKGPLPAVAEFAPFAAMVVVLLVAGLLARRTPDEAPARLLLLRAFGDRQRSSRLLRDLTVYWRWVGSVELITGTDLATELLEPHEFLDYLRGRLKRRFVRDAADLDRRLGELDLRPDLDGRYRVNEMCCHDDTWRLAVTALVSDVDVVLIDLRGLTAARTGVIEEIACLAALLPLARVVAVTDATTDAAVLRWALDRASGAAPVDAPLHHDAAPTLRTVTLSDDPSDLDRLLDTVAHAAGAAASPATAAERRGGGR